jgi:hypothetical protein
VSRNPWPCPAAIATARRDRTTPETARTADIARIGEWRTSPEAASGSLELDSSLPTMQPIETIGGYGVPGLYRQN